MGDSIRNTSRNGTEDLREKLGVCQWFHFEAYEDVEKTLEYLDDLGVKHLRTGISWADYYRPGGKEWYDWQMRRLAETDVEVLLSIWHTPPSISEDGSCAGPPKDLKAYADFLDLILSRYGESIGAVELWNEPNNWRKWDFRQLDPKWRKFATMVGMAGYWAREMGKITVLGGMIPVDHHWLNLMKEYDLLSVLDVIAIHGFPGMWWENHPNWDWYHHWKGWERKVQYIAEHAEGKPVWVTETGIATWDLDLKQRAKEDLQVLLLEKAARAPAGRVYWYSLIDLDPDREAIEGYHVDENEYHMGLVRWDGIRKPAYARFKQLLRTGAGVR